MKQDSSTLNGRWQMTQLLVLSFLALYFELIVIRWLSSEIRIFAYLKNLPLIASFLGLGLGCACARSDRKLFEHFPLAIGVLCCVIALSGQLGITFLPFPIGDYLIVGDVAGGFDYSTFSNKVWALVKFLGVVLSIFGLCVYVFLTLGQRLGRLLESLPPLPAYTINVLGSLMGVVVFSAISLAGWPPLAWFTLGFGLLLVCMERRLWAGAIFAATLLAILAVPQKALWSPYYRIDVAPLLMEEGNVRSGIVGYNLNVNHDYHQRMLKLSEGSLETSFTKKARPYYDLPYRFARPESVLVVGAGSGNDVASALRHDAQHVDAVEIDPLIIRLGRELHPDRPYSSNRVRVINNDARAFFKRSQEKYDLIVFGLLDSQTLLSSMSSIRLDNYIYTLESLKEARNHLRESGTICLSFALTEAWIQERFYRMMRETFGQEPLCLGTPYDAGISYLVGPTANRDYIRGQAELEAMVINDRIPRTGTPLPTDDWPFLYLRNKSIPFAYWFTLLFLVVVTAVWIKKIFLWTGLLRGRHHDRARLAYMFLLGAGFMLVEVKSISDLSLLFGSTWLVNSVAISSVLLMVLMSTGAVFLFRPEAKSWLYVSLAACLMVSYFFKTDSLAGLSFYLKSAMGGLVFGLPIFFAGILFASAFSKVENPSAAFAANLLGALVGGVLENLCMVFGIRFLNLLALAIYLLSICALYKSGWFGMRLISRPITEDA